MAKYRLLTLLELKELEKEFINYLILNGIAADDWSNLKERDLDKANKIVELFSDVVFETIFRKVEYLDFYSPKEIRSFHCQPNQLVLIGLKANGDGDVDFTDPKYMHQYIKDSTHQYNIYTSQKKYKVQREIELFHMTEAGCTISEGKLFKSLLMSLPK